KLREPGDEVAVDRQSSPQMHLHGWIERWFRVANRIGRAREQRAEVGCDRVRTTVDVVGERAENRRQFLRKGLEPRIDSRGHRGEVDVEAVMNDGEQREEHSQGVAGETRDVRALGLRVRASAAPLELRLVLEA